MSFFEEIVQIFGVPKSVGQIYGLLYATPTPLSFSDIVERLEISKGSASQGLHLLRSLGAINVADVERQVISDKREAHSAVGKQVAPADRKLPPLGLTPNARDATRRVAYVPELSLRRLVSGVLRERIVPMAATGAVRLERLRDLAEQDGRERDFYVNRAKQLEKWRRRLRTVLPMLGALLGPPK